MAGAVAAMGTMMLAPAARANTIVNVLKFGAVGNGQGDQTAAFQAAFKALPAFGGTIYVPTGTFRFATPLVLDPTATLTIEGDGEELSILSIAGPSGVTIQPAQYGGQITVRQMGITGTGATAAASALSIVMPGTQGDPGSQTCNLRDISITGNITCGIVLTNAWKSFISNVRMVGSSAAGTAFAVMDGICIDNRFEDCYAEQLDIAYLINGYSEGVRLQKPLVVSCNTGVYTGAGPNNTFSKNINVNGLYIDDGAFDCAVQALNLYQVWTGFITNSHLGANGGQHAAAVNTCSLIGCQAVLISNSEITGSGNSAGVGVVMTSTPTAGCTYNQVDSCLFENVNPGVGIVFGPTVQSNIANGMRLVNQATFGLLTGTNIALDQSGNTTNQVQYFNTQGQLTKLR